MYKETRCKQYPCLNNMINEHDQHDQDFGKCIQFINKIKEHRHGKIKTKQIDKFKCLYFKQYGYYHNFTRNFHNIDNINHNHSLSRQSNKPSRNSTALSNASSNPTVPATPMALHLHPLWTQHPQHPQWHLTIHLQVPDIHLKSTTKPKCWLSTSPKPPSPLDNYHSWKKVQTLP